MICQAVIFFGLKTKLVRYPVTWVVLLDACDCEFARLTCLFVFGSFGLPAPVLVGEVDGEAAFSAVPLLVALAGRSLSSI